MAKIRSVNSVYREISITFGFVGLVILMFLNIGFGIGFLLAGIISWPGFTYMAGGYLLSHNKNISNFVGFMIGLFVLAASLQVSTGSPEPARGFIDISTVVPSFLNQNN